MVYGLFISFAATLIIAVGGLYLLIKPNPLVDTWHTVNQQLSLLSIPLRRQLPNDMPSRTSSISVTEPESRDAQPPTELNDQSADTSPENIPPPINDTAHTTLGSTVSLSELPTNDQQKAPPTSVLGAHTSAGEITDLPLNSPPDYQLNQLYRLINTHRQENRLSQLSVSLALERSARAKLNDMIKDNYWQHQNKAGLPTWQFLKDAGYQYQLAGENLAFNHNSAWKTFEGWLHSPEHNAQMLHKDYDDMGAAVDCISVRDKDGFSCVVVLHLGKSI